jgi:hypothetical protein
MKISDAIKELEAIKARHGDIQVFADCGYCGKATAVGVLAVEPETARLRPRQAVEPGG